MTISEGMVLQKMLRSRVNDLMNLRNNNAVRTRSYAWTGEEEKKRSETEPQYDPKMIDRKITEINSVLFKIDSAIKMANAKTEISVQADVDKLLEPIS